MSTPAYDLGVPAVLGIWILTGAACAAWLAQRLAREQPLGWGRHLGLVVIVLFGPLACLAVAGYLTTRPPKVRRKVRS
jgi:hypothetical protein